MKRRWIQLFSPNWYTGDICRWVQDIVVSFLIGLSLSNLMTTDAYKGPPYEWIPCVLDTPSCDGALQLMNYPLINPAPTQAQTLAIGSAITALLSATRLFSNRTPFFFVDSYTTGASPFIFFIVHALLDAVWYLFLASFQYLSWFLGSQFNTPKTFSMNPLIAIPTMWFIALISAGITYIFTILANNYPVTALSVAGFVVMFCFNHSGLTPTLLDVVPGQSSWILMESSYFRYAIENIYVSLFPWNIPEADDVALDLFGYHNSALGLNFFLLFCFTLLTWFGGWCSLHLKLFWYSRTGISHASGFTYFERAINFCWYWCRCCFRPRHSPERHQHVSAKNRSIVGQRLTQFSSSNEGDPLLPSL